MKSFALWEVSGNHIHELEEILKRDLRKSWFSKKLEGNGVLVKYQDLIIKSPPDYKPIHGTRIELYADEPDVARPIYQKIKRWIKGIPIKEIVGFRVSNNLDNYLDTVFELEQNRN